MKCSKCGEDFEEKDIEESHDVPCYLWIAMKRKEQKQHADKFGRHWLCKTCHKNYEYNLSIILKQKAQEFAKVYFKEDKNEGYSI